MRRRFGLLLVILLLAPSTALADEPFTWSAPTKAMDNGPGRPVQLSSVDCPTTTFCVAVDEAGNVLTSANPTGGPGSWTVAAISARELLAVSCASTTLCVAVGTRGTIATSTNPAGGTGAWTAVNVGDERYLSSVSCPSTSLCVAVDGTNAITSTNPTGGAGAWSAATVAGVTGLSDVTCPKTDLCVAVGGGHAVTSANPAGGSATWSSPASIGSGSPNLYDVACFAGSAVCRTIDYLTGNLYATSDAASGVWGSATAIDAGGFPSAISCVATRCAVVDYSGNAVAQKNAGYVAQNISPYPFEDVSCPSISLCVAVTRNGSVLTSTGPFAEGTTAWVSTSIDRANELLEISCAGEAFCATIDRGGSAAISTAPGASPPIWSIGGSTGTPSGLSCTTPAFCVAVTPYGDVLATTDPGAPGVWPQTFLGSVALGPVSCPSTSLCVAAAPAGQVYWSTDPGGGAGAWHADTIDNPAGRIYDVSCPTVALCVAVNGTNGTNVLVSTNPTGGPAAWSSAAVPGIGPTVVSCASSSLCVAAGDNLVATSTNPLGGAASWSVAQLTPGFQTQAIDCAEPSTCVAVDYTGRAAMTSAPTAGAAAWTIREIAGTHSLGDIDCPTRKLCVAIDEFGYATVGTGVPDPVAPGPPANPTPSPPPTPTPTPVPISQSRDSAAPNTVGLRSKISRRKRTARFTFRGTDTGAPAGSKLRFRCRLDKGRYAACRSPKSYKRLRAGRHTFYVRAVDAAGNVDRSPARLRFRI